ncbi:hypothetical protein ACHAXT_004095 [Thalassiosira profunda]
MRGSVDPPAGGGSPRRGRLPDPAGLSWRYQPLPTIPEAEAHWPNEEDRHEVEEERSVVAKQRDRKKARRSRATVAAAFLALAGATGAAAGGVRKVASGRREARAYRNLMARVEASEYTDDEKERALAVAKDRWPGCVSARLSAIQCKNMIDQEVLDGNTENDRFIRTIIVGKRKKNDPLSNSIVIMMDDHDRVLGRDGDGMIHYDFLWSGSGVEASRYQQRKIPPIIAEEVSPDITIESVEVNIVPVRILGAATDDAIAEYSTAPIYGGVRIVDGATNTAAGDAYLNTELSSSVTIEAPGERSLGPFDCTGLTGRNCCLMIKHKIRDADTGGRAVQCYLDYAEGTVKREALLNSRGKKVFIYTNHNGRITKEPKVVGDWPGGVGDFDSWIQEGGGLSNGQMRLIHGDDWVPPGQAE